jgi:hypothetical protein
MILSTLIDPRVTRLQTKITFSLSTQGTITVLDDGGSRFQESAGYASPYSAQRGAEGTDARGHDDARKRTGGADGRGYTSLKDVAGDCYRELLFARSSAARNQDSLLGLMG